MQLVRYDPVRDLDKMEKDIDKFWETSWGLVPSVTDSTAMDLYEEDGKLISEVSLPNFNKGEVKLTVDDGVLQISAEHKEKDSSENKRRYYVRETNNRYLRRVVLPEGINTDKIEAEFKNGRLKVTMPEALPPAKSETIIVPIK